MHETMQMLRNSLWGYLALFLAIRWQSVQIWAMQPFFALKGLVCGICRSRNACPTLLFIGSVGLSD